MRRVQLVLLCEDSQHEAFARRFLKKEGWSQRGFRIEKAPGGKGSGEQFIRQRYPAELQALRRQRVSRALVVLIDGDAVGTAGRERELEQACLQQGVPVRSAGEPVAIFVPTRNVETWLAYLDGESVDERRNYPRLRRERECLPHVETLHRMCREGHLREPSPPSLVAACDEYERLRRTVP